MKIEDELNAFNLKENYTEKELEEAYKRKLEELQISYEILKSRLNKIDTKKFQEEINDKINRTLWKIIFSEKIEEEMAKKLFTLLLDIKKKIQNGVLDPELLIYLKALKFNNTQNDLSLLFLLSKGINPEEKEKVRETLSSQEYLKLAENPLETINNKR